MTKTTNGTTTTRALALVGLAMASTGCNRSEGGGAPSASATATAAAPTPIPEAFRGQWYRKQDNRLDYSLSVGPLALSGSDNLNGAIALKAGRAESPTSFLIERGAYSGYGSPGDCVGSLSVKGKALTVALAGEGYGCSEFSGTYKGAGVCGDGEKDPGEQCDSGKPEGNSYCTAQCKILH